ncbi:MAG TPA: magnesium transporter CorA family protein [Candidatus Acidoferrales bacterium]|nr:magnesium transporter CorA family protein [Candidatus Acidoferrales bacterium]
MKRLCARGTTADHLRALLDRHEPLWLDLDNTDPEQHALLADVFHFHPLTLEDTLDRHTRVKVEEYDGYLFVVIRSMALGEDSPASARSLDVSKICLYVNSTCLVSVHAGDSGIGDRAEARTKSDDPGLAAHAICDVAIDDYFPILDRVDDYVDRLEQTSPQDLAPHDFREALRMQSLASAAQRSLLPQQPIFSELARLHGGVLSHEAQLYFRDVNDHVTRIVESLDPYRDLIGMMSDNTISRISTRLDYATTIFEAIATVTIPFIVISGLFSMNLAGLPLSANRYGFWIVVAAQIAISAMLFAVLRRRRLL